MGSAGSCGCWIEACKGKPSLISSAGSTGLKAQLSGHKTQHLVSLLQLPEPPSSATQRTMHGFHDILHVNGVETHLPSW